MFYSINIHSKDCLDFSFEGQMTDDTKSCSSESTSFKTKIKSISYGNSMTCSGRSWQELCKAWTLHAAERAVDRRLVGSRGGRTADCGRRTVE